MSVMQARKAFIKRSPQQINSHVYVWFKFVSWMHLSFKEHPPLASIVGVTWLGNKPGTWSQGRHSNKKKKNVFLFFKRDIHYMAFLMFFFSASLESLHFRRR